MGPNWVAFKTLFTALDLDVILPDPTNREAIKIGVRYSPEFVCFPFKATIGDFKNALALQEVTGRRDPFIYSKFVKAVIFFLKKAKLLNDIQTAEGVFRAYERNLGDTTNIFNDLLLKLDEANTLSELRNFKKVIKEDFNSLDIDKTRSPLKVGLSGEIHISLEPYVNLDIRRKLGEMQIEIHQSLIPTLCLT